MTEKDNANTPQAGKRKIFLPLIFVSLLTIVGILATNRQEVPEILAKLPAVVETVKPVRSTVTGTPETSAQAAATESPATPAATDATAAPTSASLTSAAATPRPTDDPFADTMGALIQVSMDSQIGVLLDEIPEAMRDRVVAYLLDQSNAFWAARAERQVQLTLRRLNFRNFLYAGRGQLPLPPTEVWSFEFDPAGPARQEIQGHDYVTISYSFSSTLLTDAESPARSEPALANVGGAWNERFVLPVDPELLLQRTGNACVNEAGFPPNSYDSENAWVFYDHTCTAQSVGAAGCHRTHRPDLSCAEALALRVGSLETRMRFERLPWDPQLADEVRVGDVTHEDAPDMWAREDDLENHWIIYRYFTPNACALREHCIGAPGWRRLLQFNATVHNIGAEPLHIGQVSARNPAHNLFYYDSCHDHFHFINYGEFIFGESEELASKQAFCVQSTGRFSNNELSPLDHNYSCRNQGIQAGWADEYIAGLDCQWIDITDIVPPAPVTATESVTTTLAIPLTFTFNEEQFLCEGTPIRDEAGRILWEPSELTREDGSVIYRPQCEFIPDWEANNRATIDVTVPFEGGLVTLPCSRDHIGPLRNCGFTRQPLPPQAAATPAGGNQSTAQQSACTPGQPVRLSCSVADGSQPQVLRVCETSAALGTGIACTHQDALVNLIIGGDATNVQFTCPGPRDEQEPGGDYAFYTAPVFPADALQTVTCTEASP